MRAGHFNKWSYKLGKVQLINISQLYTGDEGHLLQANLEFKKIHSTIRYYRQ